MRAYLRHVGGVLRQAGHEAGQHGAHLDGGLHLRADSEQRLQRGEVELVGEDLDDHIHEITLSDRVFARQHFFQHLRQHNCLILWQTETF